MASIWEIGVQVADTKRMDTIDRLRRWRQAALVLNASRRFRYMMDLKKKEERDKILRKFRAHVLAIRAAWDFRLAAKEAEQDRQLGAACNMTRSTSGVYSDEAGTLTYGGMSDGTNNEMDDGTKDVAAYGEADIGFEMCMARTENDKMSTKIDNPPDYSSSSDSLDTILGKETSSAQIQRRQNALSSSRLMASSTQIGKHTSHRNFTGDSHYAVDKDSASKATVLGKELPKSLHNKQIDDKAPEDAEAEESDVCVQEGNCSAKRSKRGGGRRGRTVAAIRKVGKTIQPTVLFTTQTLENHPSMYIRLGRNPPERNLVPQDDWSRAFDIWSTAAVVYKGLLHEAGFGDFLKIQPYVVSLRGYMSALVERYFSETHTLHLGTFEIGPTPLAWTMITGIRFDGDPLNPPDISPSECAELLGLENSAGIFSKGKVNLCALFPRTLDFSKDPADSDLDWMFRRLVVYLVGSCFFSGKDLMVPIRLVSAMSDIRKINRYDWGAATFSAFLRGMREKTSECSGSFSGFYTFLLLWAYEHLPVMRPVTKLGVDTFPRACRWESTESRCHIPSDFIWYRLALEYLKEDQVNFDPYKNLTEKGCYQCEAELSQKRIIFQGLESCEVYMGERNLRQFGGKNRIPQPPPAKRFCGRSDDIIREFPPELCLGSNAWDLVEDEELDYAEWFRTHSLGKIVDLEQFGEQFTLEHMFLEPWLCVNRDGHKMMPPHDLQTLQETSRKWEAKYESVQADLKAAVGERRLEMVRANEWEAYAKSLEVQRCLCEADALHARARVRELEAICSHYGLPTTLVPVYRS